MAKSLKYHKRALLNKLETKILELYRYDRKQYEKFYTHVKAQGVDYKRRQYKGHFIKKDISLKKLSALEKQLSNFDVAKMKKERKRQFDRYRTENPNTTIKSAEEYQEKREHINDILSEIFNTYSSKQAREIYDEIVLYDDSESAIDRILEVLQDEQLKEKTKNFSSLTDQEFFEIWGNV